MKKPIPTTPRQAQLSNKKAGGLIQGLNNAC